MVKYRQFVAKSDNKYQRYAVAMFDMVFRAEMGRLRSLNFGSPDTNMKTKLVNTILDSTAVTKTALKCFRCGSYDHVVGECPFPEDYPGTDITGPKAPPGWQRQ